MPNFRIIQSFLTDLTDGRAAVYSSNVKNMTEGRKEGEGRRTSSGLGL